MSWLILTLLSVLIVSVANILSKVLMRGNGSSPYAYAVFFHFLLGFLNLGYALWVGADFSIAWSSVPLLIVASALWAACSAFNFKAIKLLEASEVTILSTGKVVVTIVASVLFLHEVFSAQNIVGALIIVIATLLVVNLREGFKLNRGVLYTIAIAFFAGLAFVVDSSNVKLLDVVAYNTIANFIIAMILLAVYPRVLKQWKHFVRPAFLKNMIPLGVLSTAQGILYLQALTFTGYTSQIATIRQASVIVTVLLAVVFLRERDHLARKLAAAVLVTCGVLLLG